MEIGNFCKVLNTNPCHTNAAYKPCVGFCALNYPGFCVRALSRMVREKIQSASRRFAGCITSPRRPPCEPFGLNCLHCICFQERSHFGLWCMMSSPLVLGFNMSNKAQMDRVWPIITNRMCFAVPCSVLPTRLAGDKILQALVRGDQQVRRSRSITHGLVTHCQISIRSIVFVCSVHRAQFKCVECRAGSARADTSARID
jgi:hypothetical protein